MEENTSDHLSSDNQLTSPVARVSVSNDLKTVSEVDNITVSQFLESLASVALSIAARTGISPEGKSSV